jgi:hypothetical protein
MLADFSKKHYISNTMSNLHIFSTIFAAGLIASAILLRKMFALRATVLRTKNLR